MSKKNHSYASRETWIESKGGLLLSLFIHLALFSFLMTKYPERLIPKNMPIPLSLLLNLTHEPDGKDAVSFTPARSTYQEEKGEQLDSTKTLEEIRDEIKEDALEKTPLSPQHPLPEFHAEIEKMETELERSITEVRSAIERRSIKARGSRESFDSSGAEEGTVRALDIGNVPERISEQVLQKYRIRITKKYIDGENNVFFLNKVQVRDKTFISGRASGYYEVFEIPMEAVKKMTLLESAEFSRRKLDPSRTRIKKITFGIVKTDGEYDLGITEFNYQEID